MRFKSFPLILTDQILVPFFFLYITNRIELNFSPRLILYRSKNLEKPTDIRIKAKAVHPCSPNFHGRALDAGKKVERTRVRSTEQEERTRMRNEGGEGEEAEGKRGRAPLPLALPLDTNSEGCPKRCRWRFNRARKPGAPTDPRGTPISALPFL